MQHNHTSHGEPDIIRLAREADPGAWSVLWRQHHRTVLTYCRSRVHQRGTAEDLASEVWVRAMRSIGSYRWTGRPFAAWLVTIARNLITDHVKSSRVRLERCTDDPGALVREQEPGLDVAYLRAVDRAEVRQLVAALPPGQRRVIVARYWCDLKFREIGAETGRTKGAARVVQTRALRSLASSVRRSGVLGGCAA